MRYSILLMFGALLAWPAEASACHRRGCYGSTCSGCYGRCSGGYNGGCSGCYGGHCSGCYGGYHSHYGCAGGYYQQSYGVPRQQLPAPGTRSSNYYDPNVGLGRTVSMEVIVNDPAANITIQGVSTSSEGNVRRFESPMLEEGRNYIYTVTMSSNGKARDTRQLNVRPGERVVLDFTKPAEVDRTVPVRRPEEVQRTSDTRQEEEKPRDLLLTPKSDLPK